MAVPAQLARALPVALQTSRALAVAVPLRPALTALIAQRAAAVVAPHGSARPTLAVVVVEQSRVGGQRAQARLVAETAARALALPVRRTVAAAAVVVAQTAADRLVVPAGLAS
jgi:hypothetical protein